MTNLSTFWDTALDIAIDIGVRFIRFFEKFATETVLDWGHDLGLIIDGPLPNWILKWLDVPWLSVMLVFGLTAYPLYQLAKWTVGIITGA